MVVRTYGTPSEHKGGEKPVFFAAVRFYDVHNDADEKSDFCSFHSYGNNHRNSDSPGQVKQGSRLTRDRGDAV